MLSSESISLDTKPAYIVWIAALSVYGVTAVWTEIPQNLALVVGNTGYMNCTSDITTSNLIQWLRGTNPIAGCYNVSSSKPGYSCEATTPNSCNLIILNVTTDQAGQYQCYPLAGVEPSAYAQLIVLETESQCVTQPMDTVNISDTVRMSCSARCNGTLGPVMTWYDVRGDVIVGDNEGSAQHPDYVIHVSPTIPTVPEYKCNTSFKSVPTFEPPPTDGTTANNTPSYSSLCSTSPLSVQYPPYAENITITPDASKNLHIGDVLTCNAVAHPPVISYQWSNESAVLVNDAALILEQNGNNITYWCKVNNALGFNSKEIVVNVIPIPVIRTSEPGRQTTSSTASGGEQFTTQEYPIGCYDCSSCCSIRIGLGLGLGLGIPLLISVFINGVLLWIYVCGPRGKEINIGSLNEHRNDAFDDTNGSRMGLSSSDHKESPQYENLKIDIGVIDMPSTTYASLERTENSSQVLYEKLNV